MHKRHCEEPLRYDTAIQKIATAKIKQQAVYLDRHATSWLAMTVIRFYNLVFYIISCDF
ncbi:hypothetical protein [Candidatus Tisiphia endosymbiont of Hybos culiciformis]|uniref:hypothetical protein n=1 Tax=Candidatus Tisiphia endosymbiont of Hybos culiciformis TaxID=3139331 RepID=UPI003CCB0552